MVYTNNKSRSESNIQNNIWLVYLRSNIELFRYHIFSGNDNFEYVSANQTTHSKNGKTVVQVSPFSDAFSVPQSAW